MIEIQAIIYNGRPPAAELRGVFGPQGGTIGRGPDNRLILPDPARHVSRVQASIRFDGSRFLISNVSLATPLFVNEEELETGTERALAPGDGLRVGLYQLAVREAADASSTLAANTAPEPDAIAATPPPVPGIAPSTLDPLLGLDGGAAGSNPFADLLGVAASPQVPLGTAPLLPEPMPTPVPLSANPPPAAAQSGDPFSDLMQPAAPTAGAHVWVPSMVAPAAAGKATFADGIPDDFDAFAMPSRAPRNSEDPLRDLAGASIELNAVGAGDAKSSMLEFDLTKRADPGDLLQGGTPSLVDPLTAVDPLDLFGGPDDRLLHGEADPLAGGPAMRDNVPALGVNFRPPRSFPEGPAVAPAASLAHASPPAPSKPTPEPQHKASPTEAERPIVSPQSARPADAVSAKLPASTTAPPRAQAPAATSVAKPAPPAAPATRIGATDPLLAAFLKGAGVPNMAMPNGLTPEMMESIGALAYRAIAGAMELIAARQITKREIRAEVTMIVSHDNNPLKFLPTPEAAIMQMLGPNMPGFMSTSEAMQDAFDDLAAHEVGVIAGMRAALAAVLKRFDPAVLEQRLGENGLLDSLVPNAREAKLWRLFGERFQEILGEVSDDFQALFGKAFIKAYDEQVALDRAKRKRG